MCDMVKSIKYSLRYEPSKSVWKIGLCVGKSCSISNILCMVWQITRRDEGMLPFIAGPKRNYIFGSICIVAANSFIKVCMPPSFRYSYFCNWNLFYTRNVCVSHLNDWQAHYWLLGFEWYKIYQPIWGSTDMSQLHCTGAGWVSFYLFSFYLILLFFPTVRFDNNSSSSPSS